MSKRTDILQSSTDSVRSLSNFEAFCQTEVGDVQMTCAQQTTDIEQLVKILTIQMLHVE